MYGWPTGMPNALCFYRYSSRWGYKHWKAGRLEFPDSVRLSNFPIIRVTGSQALLRQRKEFCIFWYFIIKGISLVYAICIYRQYNICRCKMQVDNCLVFLLRPFRAWSCFIRVFDGLCPSLKYFAPLGLMLNAYSNRWASPIADVLRPLRGFCYVLFFRWALPIADILRHFPEGASVAYIKALFLESLSLCGCLYCFDFDLKIKEIEKI